MSQDRGPLEPANDALGPHYAYAGPAPAPARPGEGAGATLGGPAAGAEGGQGTSRPSAGSGSVAEVMAGWDWASTPVGPAQGWPATLRTMVQVVLASRFPMWMGWGPELTFFYNDAYRRDTLGVKHPWALGRPAREVWAEIWPDLEPRVAAVMESGSATWDQALLLYLQRSGYREETYHTFSYSPVPGPDGAPEGLLCVVTEETGRVIGERRMTTLRQLASELSGTRTEAEVFAAVRSRLSQNRRDLPFTLVYAYDAEGRASLVSSTGLQLPHPAAPEQIGPGATEAAWPAGVMRSEPRLLVVDDLRRRFGQLPAGACDEPPSAAAVVPLAGRGEGPSGFLVAGLNPYRAFDSQYEGFLELLAGQVAAGLASARAYDAERRRAESLAELDRAKTEFFSNVSHEFRTPLTLILGPVEDSLNDNVDPLPSAQVARLEVVRRNARRLRRLVNDMLDFARIEGGRLQAETVPTDLDALTRDVVASFAPAIEQADLGLEVECAALPRPVVVDPDMWEKIVLNLLSNALKFTLEGTIRVSLTDGGDHVCLSVSDTGVGVPANQLPLLFQRFHRAPLSAARSHEGTGIGLALVHELARLHGGTAGVQSTEGEGSNFWVRLPYGERGTGTAVPQRDSARQAYLDEALQWGPATEVAPEDFASARTAEATVLVVDDNPDMRAHLARLMSPYWRVVLAKDGEHALALARVQRPDLVLTDVMMPGLDGFGLLEALRADRETATVPVIFLSARAGEEAAVEGLEAGADDYLVKPFSAVELLARVRSNLELARLRNRDAAWRAALVESLSEGVAVMGPSGTVTEVNAAFSQVLGYGSDGLPYEMPYPWFPDPVCEPEDHARMLAVMGTALRHGRCGGVVPARHRDGRRIHLEVSVVSVDDEDERRFVMAVRDVTADLLATEREAALARFGMRLAEAGDVRQVQEVGLDELGRLFGADAHLEWHAAVPGAGPSAAVGAGESQRTGAEAMDAARETGRVVLIPGAEAVFGPDEQWYTGMAAPLEPAAHDGAVWLSFATLRRVSLEDRALFGLLSGYLGQAMRRAQLFDDSKAVATALQRSILGPQETPAAVAVHYAPAVRPLEVGGDWYDVVELPDGRLGLVVGDCVGRGLQAATVMGQLRSACRALLLQMSSPAQVLSALDTFAERVPGAACTTVFCGVLDPRDDSLRFCSAGHLPAALVSFDGAAKLLNHNQSLPLGVLPGTQRSEAAEQVAPGALLVVYTDGLVERRGETIDVGIGRLVDAVREARALTPRALTLYLTRLLVPDDAQKDDVALVVYRQPGEVAAARFAVTVEAVPRELAGLRRQLCAWLHQHGVDGQSATELLVACGEACSNAVEHAYPAGAPGQLVVEGEIEPGRVRLRVSDTGRWRVPAQRGEDRGRGLQIMRGLTSRAEVVGTGDGTTVDLVKELLVD